MSVLPLNERWYRMCRERGIVPPIGPDGPPPLPTTDVR
jgi:hypothetical protein